MCLCVYLRVCVCVCVTMSVHVCIHDTDTWTNSMSAEVYVQLGTVLLTVVTEAARTDIFRYVVVVYRVIASSSNSPLHVHYTTRDALMLSRFHSQASVASR